MRNELTRTAVVGAGMSGLICARTLADRGVSVVVFEKSRGTGGRMATRRTDGGLAFDHGAQYLTVCDGRFEGYVRSWQQAGLVASWEGSIRVLEDGRIEPCRTERERFVGTPTMSSVCKHLAAKIEVRLQCEVGSLERVGESWRLIDPKGEDLGNFDLVVISAPAPQAARLLAPVGGLAEEARRVQMQPCWALMAAFDDRLPLPFDGAFVHGSPLAWVARSSSKPGRSLSRDCWVLHASPEWSEEHVEAVGEEVVAPMLDAFFKAAGTQPARPDFTSAHRWRYARPTKTLEDRFLRDQIKGLVACGEWCAGPRVEGAFLSGLAAAESILLASGLEP
ncbi:MAG: NAD(P)/FAD-dependent oxidoreductase [Planctomycetota bacterium]